MGNLEKIKFINLQQLKKENPDQVPAAFVPALALQAGPQADAQTSSVKTTAPVAVNPAVASGTTQMEGTLSGIICQLKLVIAGWHSKCLVSCHACVDCSSLIVH